MPGLASAARTLALVGAGLALLACDPPEYSDEGKYLLDVSLSQPLGTRSRQVLVGSSFTAELTGLGSIDATIDPDQGGLECASLSASGSLVQDGEGLSVAAPGLGVLDIGDPALACPANTDALATIGPDRWTIEGVPMSEVVGRWAISPHVDILNWALSPGPRREFPQDFAAPSTGLLVVAGGQFSAYPALVRADGSEVEVRWFDVQHQLLVPARYDELRPSDESTGRQRWLSGSLGPGEGFESELEVLGQRIELPPVEAVSVDVVAALELVPVFDDVEPGEAREWGPPVGAVALTYDSDGRRVIGSPVEFSVTRGRLGLDISESDDGVASLLANCSPHVDKPTLRGATVEARLGDLVDRVDLEWVALPSDDPDREDLSRCQGSIRCDCRSVEREDPARSVLGLLGLFGLAFVRHRRRRRAASTRTT